MNEAAPLTNLDLDHVLANSEPAWEQIRGRRIFITGGTGFFGCWLLETFLHANRKLVLKSQIFVLTRSPKRFREKAPHLAVDDALTIIEGDLSNFQYPSGNFDFLIHAAAAVAYSQQAPVATLESETVGLHRVFAFIRQAGVRRVLFISSGGLYGAQAGTDPIVENAPCTLDPSNPASLYGELKRYGELYCACSAQQFGIEVVLARCFSSYGPYQDMNSHFAAANFMRDALAGRDIHVQGDGLAQRSYLYAADLVIWLWRLLVSGHSCLPYNVGSAVPVSISDLAHTIARLAGGRINVQVLGKPQQGLAPNCYLPDVERAEEQLGLIQHIGLEEGLARTMDWNRQNERAI